MLLMLRWGIGKLFGPTVWTLRLIYSIEYSSFNSNRIFGLFYLSTIHFRRCTYRESTNPPRTQPKLSDDQIYTKLFRHRGHVLWLLLLNHLNKHTE